MQCSKHQKLLLARICNSEFSPGIFGWVPQIAKTSLSKTHQREGGKTRSAGCLGD